MKFLTEKKVVQNHPLCYIFLIFIFIYLFDETTEHGNEDHNSYCTDCKEREYRFEGDHNNVNKYHEDDKNPEHHPYHRDNVENHGHEHRHHTQDFGKNHGHRYRGHGHN